MSATIAHTKRGVGKMRNMNMLKCCICGQIFIGYGNNPWPVNKKEDAVCCDDCNYRKVIPARLAMMSENQDNGTEQSK